MISSRFGLCDKRAQMMPGENSGNIHHDYKWITVDKARLSIV
jgi:hypothetical protein